MIRRHENVFSCRTVRIFSTAKRPKSLPYRIFTTFFLRKILENYSSRLDFLTMWEHTLRVLLQSSAMIFFIAAKKVKETSPPEVEMFSSSVFQRNVPSCSRNVFNFSFFFMREGTYTSHGSHGSHGSHARESVKVVTSVSMVITGHVPLRATNP